MEEVEVPGSWAGPDGLGQRKTKSSLQESLGRRDGRPGGKQMSLRCVSLHCEISPLGGPIPSIQRGPRFNLTPQNSLIGNGDKEGG